MLRNATNLLTKWNARKNRKPLIVWGARQVGKTYLVKDIFAEEYYSNSYIYIDFKIEDEIRDFCDHTANAEKIIEYICLYKHRLTRAHREKQLKMSCQALHNAPPNRT